METENKISSVCNLQYLIETVGGKKHLILEIMDVFLKQVPEELQAIDKAIKLADYATIKNYVHTMKSSVSIMGISSLASVLQEMEDLAIGIGHSGVHQMEKIKELNEGLNRICTQAITEIERQKIHFI